MLAPGPDMEEIHETIEKIVRTAARNEVGGVGSEFRGCLLVHQSHFLAHTAPYSAFFSSLSRLLLILPPFLPPPRLLTRSTAIPFATVSSICPC